MLAVPQLRRPPKQQPWQQSLAQKISRNRKLGSRQYILDEAHAQELYHQRRRIATSGSLTEVYRRR